jgi:F420 biosynthesis protein FbiB-like protein
MSQGSDALQIIRERRSIRRFQARPVSPELIEEILDLTVQAPSAKNAQPWRFVVLEGERAAELASRMQRKAEKLASLNADSGSLAWSAQVVAQAPVTIMVFNVGAPSEIPVEFHDDYQFVMTQSTGGAIQTMLLAAQALGLGSLWICDVLYIYDEIRHWLGHPEDVLIAAVSLGYADEAPRARPRRPWQEVTEWDGDLS